MSIDTGMVTLHAEHACLLSLCKASGSMLKGSIACVHPGLASRESLALDSVFFEGAVKDTEVSETTTPCAQCLGGQK